MNIRLFEQSSQFTTSLFPYFCPNLIVMFNQNQGSAPSISQESSPFTSSSIRGGKFGAFPFFLATSSSSSLSDLTNAPIEFASPSKTSSSPISTSNANEQSLVNQEMTRQKEVCDNYIVSGLTWNVTIKFLMERLVNMGCKPPPRFIRCIDCGNTKAGGGFGILEERISHYHPETESSEINKRHEYDRKGVIQQQAICDDPKKNQSIYNADTSSRKLVPEIFLCQQHLVNEQHAHESLVHELIHAIDLCRYGHFTGMIFPFLLFCKERISCPL